MRYRTSVTMAALALALLVAGLGPVGAAEASRAPAEPLDLNRASAAELEQLPGVGPSLAGRIVDFREKNGGFQRVEDLLKVKGIGEKSFQKLRLHVIVGKKR